MATNIKQIRGIKHKISDTEIEQIILGANGYIYGNFGINLTNYKINQDTMESTSPFLAIGTGMGECLGSCIRPQLQLGSYGLLGADNYLQIGIGTNGNNRKAGLMYNYVNQLILNGEDERATLIIGNNITSEHLYNEYTTLSTLGVSAPRMYIGGTFNNLKNIDETYQVVINGNTHIIGDIDVTNVYATGDISTEGKVSGKTNLEHTGTDLIYLQMMKGATSSDNGTYGMVPAPSANVNTLFLSNHGTWEKPSSAISLSDLIGSSIGNNNKPIYCNGSSFQAIDYTIGKSVPSDAKFTDTVYTLPIATDTTLGGVKVPGNGIIIEEGGNLAASLNSVTKNSNLVDLPFEIKAELPAKNDITYRISGPYDSESTCNKYNMYEPSEASTEVCFTYYTSMINYSELAKDPSTGKYYLPKGTKIYLATSSSIPDNTVSCLQLFENEVIVYDQGGSATGESIFGSKRANGPYTSSEFTMDKDYYIDKIGAAIELPKSEGNPFAANFALFIRPKDSLKADTYVVFRIDEDGVTSVLNKDRTLHTL